MACVQHPGAHQHWNVDARGKGGGCWEAVSGCGCGWSLDQEGSFVVSAVEFAFGGKSKDIGELWALGRGDETQEIYWRGKKRTQRHEADGGAGHGLGALFACPVF